MKAVIKAIISPDIEDLRAYAPADHENFSLFLQLIVGTDDGEGGESFNVVVCTPDWIKQNLRKDEILVGRNHLIVREYDYDRIVRRIEKFLLHCTGNTWQDIAGKISRLGQWEFEDYNPEL